ncbi:MAG: helix-turn-helix domain-containing protein [Bacteriovoracia bacterium]
MKGNRPRRARVDSPFAKNLKAIMDKRSLTHREVAEMSGVATSVVNDWLAGSQPYDLNKVGMLAKNLGVSFERLLINSETKPSDLAITELFTELDVEELSGLFLISVKRLVKKSK